MKLKDILLEATQVEEFQQLIQRQKLIGTDGSLYRGVTAGSRVRTDTFAEVRVRRDRRPRNSSLELDAYLEGVRKRWFPDRPSRRHAAFVTPHWETAQIYGKPFYVMFPKKANIWMIHVDPYLDYFHSDPMLIFMDMKKIIDAYRQVLDLTEGTSLHYSLQDMEPVFELCQAMYDNDWKGVEKQAIIAHGLILSETDRWIESLRKLPADLPESAREIFETNEGYRIKNVLREMRSFAKGVQKYFDNLIPFNESRVDQMEEVLVETGYYYVVDVKWYDENIRERR